MLEEGESGIRWADAKDAFEQLKVAIREGESHYIQQALENMSWVLLQGTRDWAHRREILEATEKIRRLKVSEHKHMIDERYVMSKEEFEAAVMALFQMLHRHITDARIWTNIGEEWRSINQSSQLSGPSTN